MSSSNLLWAALGTLLCALGWLRRPKSGFEIFSPRFIVPAMIWLAMFGQVFHRAIGGEATPMEEQYVPYIEVTLKFACLCMVLFWLGYAMPVGVAMARPLTSLQSSINIRPGLLRLVGHSLSLFSFSLALVLKGKGLFNADYGIAPPTWLPEMAIRFLAPAGMILAGVGWALLGVTWPSPNGRSIASHVLGFFSLVLSSVAPMANFSRGAGLPFVVAAMAATFYSRRVKWVPLVLSAFWALACAHAGLLGRSVYGHDGGFFPFLHFVFTESMVDFEGLYKVGLTSLDSFYPMCVCSRAMTMTDIRTLTPLNYLICQIPIPRFLGLLPEWTVDTTLFLGGYGSWGFTTGMFGDTYIHLGYSGALLFGVMGALYRMMDRLAFGQSDTRQGGLNLFILPAFTAYYALASGLFNTYRAWVVLFFNPLFLVIGLLFLRRMFLRRADVDVDLQAQEGYALPPADW